MIFLARQGAMKRNYKSTTLDLLAQASSNHNSWIRRIACDSSVKAIEELVPTKSTCREDAYL